MAVPKRQHKVPMQISANMMFFSHSFFYSRCQWPPMANLTLVGMNVEVQAGPAGVSVCNLVSLMEVGLLVGIWVQSIFALVRGAPKPTKNGEGFAHWCHSKAMGARKGCPTKTCSKSYGFWGGPTYRRPIGYGPSSDDWSAVSQGHNEKTWHQKVVWLGPLLPWQGVHQTHVERSRPCLATSHPEYPNGSLEKIWAFREAAKQTAW